MSLSITTHTEDVTGVEFHNSCHKPFMIVERTNGDDIVVVIEDNDETRDLWGVLLAREDSGYVGSVEVTLNGHNWNLEYPEWMMFNLALFEYFLLSDVDMKQEVFLH